MEVKIQEKSGGEVAEGSGKAETGAAPWICPHCGRSFKRRNQSHYCGQKPESIDEYIAAQPGELWPYLNAVRDAIRRALPEAEETISWSMPTFRKGFKIMWVCIRGQRPLRCFQNVSKSIRPEKEAFSFCTADQFRWS